MWKSTHSYIGLKLGTLHIWGLHFSNEKKFCLGGCLPSELASPVGKPIINACLSEPEFTPPRLIAQTFAGCSYELLYESVPRSVLFSFLLLSHFLVLLCGLLCFFLIPLLFLLPTPFPSCSFSSSFSLPPSPPHLPHAPPSCSMFLAPKDGQGFYEAKTQNCKLI